MLFRPYALSVYANFPAVPRHLAPPFVLLCSAEAHVDLHRRLERLLRKLFLTFLTFFHAWQRAWNHWTCMHGRASMFDLCLYLTCSYCWAGFIVNCLLLFHCFCDWISVHMPSELCLLLQISVSASFFLKWPIYLEYDLIM